MLRGDAPPRWHWRSATGRCRKESADMRICWKRRWQGEATAARPVLDWVRNHTEDAAARADRATESRDMMATPAGLATRAAGHAAALPAQAHKPSDSYLSLDVHGDSITGQWDIALRDLDFAIGLDQDGDGKLTWDEIRLRHEAIAAYALARLEPGQPTKACADQHRRAADRPSHRRRLQRAALHAACRCR
jgi:hypothetical protein